MKKLLNFLPVITMFIIGCTPPPPGPDPGPTNGEILSDGTWGAVYVEHDGFDVTSTWDGFQVDFNDTNKTYFTLGASDLTVWPEAGNWNFQDDTGAGQNIIIRSDGVTMDMSNMSDDALTLTFIIDPPATIKTNGLMSVNSVEGEYIFRFTRP